MGIRYNSPEYGNLLRSGITVIKPDIELLQSLRRVRQVDPTARLELVKRLTMEGTEYQPMIIIPKLGEDK